MSLVRWCNDTLEWFCGTSRNRCCSWQSDTEEINDIDFTVPPSRSGLREPLENIETTANHPSDPKMVDNCSPMSFEDIVEITPMT